MKRLILGELANIGESDTHVMGKFLHITMPLVFDLFFQRHKDEYYAHNYK
jgi:hypothetical protein